MGRLPLSWQRFLKYSSVGGVTFAFDLALLYLFTDYLGIDYLVSTAIAFVIAVSLNYIVSRRFVFKKTQTKVGRGYVNFFIIAAIGLLLVTGGMYVLVSVIGVNYVIARVSIAGFTGMWNYLLNLYVNFKVAGRH
jgi:putative flippase GtrA